jgi:hypothetical protein
MESKKALRLIASVRTQDRFESAATALASAFAMMTSADEVGTASRFTAMTDTGSLEGICMLSPDEVQSANTGDEVGAQTLWHLPRAPRDWRNSPNPARHRKLRRCRPAYTVCPNALSYRRTQPNQKKWYAHE